MPSSKLYETERSTPNQSEAERILTNLRSLRDEIVTAWRERAVVLTAEERVVLRNEIKQTCEFLDVLTRDD